MHLILSVVDSKFCIEEHDEVCGVRQSEKVKSLDSTIAIIRTWLADQVREATGQFDYNKLQDNIHAAFSGLTELQEQMRFEDRLKKPVVLDDEPF